MELNFSGGQDGEEPRRDAVEVGVGGGVIDGLELALDDVGHGVAEPLLLLLAEDVGLVLVRMAGGAGQAAGIV